MLLDYIKALETAETLRTALGSAQGIALAVGGKEDKKAQMNLDRMIKDSYPERFD